MGIGTRKCRRQCSGKKILLMGFLCSVVIYIASVLIRVPKPREIWDVKDYKNRTAGFCGVKCFYNQVSFYIRTGIENKEGPIMCFQNNVLVSPEKGNVNRGLNMVVVNDKTLEVVGIKSFDTYIYDEDFKEFINKNIEEGHLVMIASYDESAVSLSEESRNWMKVLGSEESDSLNFRDSYMIIGQKGLQQGHAVEYRNVRGERRYSEVIEKTGCFSLPMGPIYPVKDILPKLTAHNFEYGNVLDLCGLSKPCPEKSFPALVFTGKESVEYPEICVNGNMVMKKNLNDAGRGMNIIVVYQQTFKVKHAAHFDTYDVDSAELASFLESLEFGDIIIAVSFDDASRKLSFQAKEAFNRLGSSLVQNLKFRDVWYFVSQKGINGFTNFERISYVAMDADWPEPIRESFCVPSIIKGSQIIPDPQVSRNDARRSFCKKYDGYGDFCDSSFVDNRPIKPVGLLDERLQNNPVYQSPVVIIPGLNHNALVKTMETTIMQPGVNLNNVIIAWDEKFPEHADLASLFGFKNMSLPSSRSYSEQMMKAIQKVCMLYKNSKYVIVLEEELILAPDFLYFLSQLHPVLESDNSLLGVSAFNYYGFETTSSKHSVVYRVEDFPGLGFMMKMPVFLKAVKGTEQVFSKVRAWDGWKIPALNISLGEMLIPDVSRVYRQPYEGSNRDEDFLVELFNKHRVTNLEKDVKLVNLEKLKEDEYEEFIAMQLKKARLIENNQIDNCIKGKENQRIQIEGQEKVWVLYYKQKHKEDYSLLEKLCQCFGIPVAIGQLPKNLHQGLLQFSYAEGQVFLIGSATKYFVYKSKSAPFYS